MAFCTHCGNDNGENRFCTRCGTPQSAEYVAPARAYAAAPPPSSSGLPRAVVFMIVALVGAPVVIGILAAIAIPKFVSVSQRAKEAEAVPVLNQIRALEHAYRTRRGTFTANLEDASADGFLVGYVDPGARYYTFSVSRATATDLCVDALPTADGAAAGVGDQSVDDEGRFYGSAGCGERMEYANEY